MKPQLTMKKKLTWIPIRSHSTQRQPTSCSKKGKASKVVAKIQATTSKCGFCFARPWANKGSFPRRITFFSFFRILVHTRAHTHFRHTHTLVQFLLCPTRKTANTMEPPPPPTPEADKFRVPKGPVSRPRTSQQQQQQSGAGSNAPDVGSSHSFSSSSSRVSTSSSTSRVSVGSTSSQAVAEGFRSSIVVSQHTTTTTTTTTNGNGVAVQSYQKPTASQFPFDQTQQITQTQILEGSDELPDDEVESPLLFGILEGRDKTMHQSLYSHEAPYTFGTSDDCDVKISHAHWPDEKKKKEPWFRLTCVS